MPIAHGGMNGGIPGCGGGVGACCPRSSCNAPGLSVSWPSGPSSMCLPSTVTNLTTSTGRSTYWMQSRGTSRTTSFSTTCVTTCGTSLMISIGTSLITSRSTYLMTSLGTSLTVVVPG